MKSKNKKFISTILMMLLLFVTVIGGTGCGGGGGSSSNLANNEPEHIPQNTYTVTFDSNGGSVVASQNVVEGEKAVEPTTPTKAGYAFGGWYSDADLTERFSFNTPITASIILYARWNAPSVTTYTVTFNSNGGSTVASQTVVKGEKAIEPTAPTKAGYAFGGWYSDADLTISFSFNAPITASITLYARWNAISVTTYTVTFNSNGGSTVASQTVVKGEKAIEPANPTREGYTFAGWYSDSTLTALFDFNAAINSDITIYAKWEAKTPSLSSFTVTFDSNGGSEVSKITVSSGSTVSAPENPTKTGYVFAGWYKDSGFTEMFVFGTDGDKVTKNITLYAQWLDTNLLVAEYAAREIIVGYANGDNSKHVTKNLTLPAKIDSADIIWVSSSGAVSSNGTVTRQDNDVDVTLTATATYNGKSSEAKTFNVKVIRKRTSTSNDIKIIDIQDLVSQDLEIEYNESGDRVTDIDGHFSDISIKNADDALDAIYSVSGLLGIDNPYKELEADGSNINKYTSVYSFAQVHDGIKVYGRYITLGADRNNTADYLSSNLISSYLLDSIKPEAVKLTQSQAEQIINTEYSHIDVIKTEQVIYSLYEYETNPVCAWKITISGTKNNSSYEDETVFINASNNTIIQRYTNIENALFDKEINGYNELNKPVKFPLGFKLLKGYYMQDKDLKITMYNENFNEENIIGPIDTSIRYQDPHQISAYTNMREVIKWWKASFDRDSLDDNGMEVKVLTHNRWGTDINGDILKDNAAWYPISRVIVIGDNSDVSHLDRTMAAALDVIAHETGHAVMQFLIGHGLSENTKQVNQDNVVASINLVAFKEAYADIFSFLKDHDWTIGDNLFFEKSASGYSYMRNARNPSDSKASTHIHAVLNATTADEEGHKASLIITHAAYLMHQDGLSKQYGLTWDELAQVWYQSLQPNAYTPTSTFLDVRKNVMRAARALNLPDNKVKNIEEAFREVGIYDDTPRLCLVSGLITDFETKLPISRATVSVMKETEYDFETIHETETNLIGMFLLIPPLKEGRYAVNVFADGYVNFRQEFTITDSAKFILNVPMIKDGKGSVKGYVCASNKNNPLEDVTVNIRRGWYEKGDTTGYIWASVVTKADGSFSFNLGENGADYYMLEMIKSGYQTSYSNIIIKGDVTEHYEYMSKANVPVPIDEEHFPDGRFRSYVQENFDTDKDRVLSITEITNIKEIYLFYNSIYDRWPITDLKGIEYFSELVSLTCLRHKVVSLNLNNCEKLEYLACNSVGSGADGTLEFLDISNCTALKEIRCGKNRLTTLDLSKNTNLVYIDCYSNNLMELDLSNQSALEYLNCSYNNLTALNLPKVSHLVELYCNNNLLTELDLSNQSALERLDYTQNNIVMIDFSKNLSLKELHSEGGINVKENIALEYLECGGENLKKLDISNNTALIYLSCTESDVAEINLDANDVLLVLSLQKNKYLTRIDARKPLLKSVYCTNNELLTELLCEGCSELETLHADDNNLSVLSLRGCSSLMDLTINNNNLTEINITDCSHYLSQAQILCCLQSTKSVKISGLQLVKNNDSNYPYELDFGVFLEYEGRTYPRYTGPFDSVSSIKAYDGLGNEIDIDKASHSTYTQPSNVKYITKIASLPAKIQFEYSGYNGWRSLEGGTITIIPHSDLIIAGKPTIIMTSLPNGIVGQDYKVILEALKMPTPDIDWEVHNLPEGLGSLRDAIYTDDYYLFSKSFYNIVGTPQKAGTFNVTLIATNKWGSSELTLPLVIHPANASVTINQSQINNQHMQDNYVLKNEKLKNISVMSSNEANSLYENKRNAGENSLVLQEGKSYQLASNNIVAILHDFIAEETCEYVFEEISFDKIAHKGSTLIFIDKVNESADLQGVFLNDDNEEITMPLKEELDHVKIAAAFEAGKAYSPVVIAKSDVDVDDEGYSGGGCNSTLLGALGLFTLSFFLSTLKKKV